MHSIIRPSPRSALFLILSVAFLVAVGGCGHRQINTSKASPDRAVKGARAQGKVDNPNKKVSDPEPNKTGKAPTYKPPPQQGPQLELSQKGVTLRWIEDGNVRMSATAREFQGNEVAKVGTLLDFSAQLYENGKMTASVRAPKAVADTANRVVTATGGVVVKSMERSTVVNASWIKWYAKQQKIVGDGGVKATSTMGTMDGAAFVADTGLKNIRILSSAKGLAL